METSYTMVQWVTFFLTYSFIGWCYESLYVSAKNKRWVNRGFMRGPFLPLYGSGAIVMLFVTIPFRDSLILTYLAGCVGATALEYATGVVMEALFKVRYWDYTNRPFNFQGHICLEATAAWGAFTILLVRFIHTPIEHFILGLPQIVVSVITTLLAAVCIADFAISFKTALDIRDVLVKLDEVRDEMERLQKRMDVIIAFADDAKEQVVLNTYERLDELSDSLEERFSHIKDLRAKMTEEYRDELDEMRIKFRIAREKRFQLLHRKDFFRSDMLLSNPMLKSRYFKNSLEDIKKAARDAVEERKQRKKK